MEQKIAFITGASSGIGAACAEIFAANNFKLILSARRIEKLKEMAQEWTRKYEIEIHCLAMDVRDKIAVQEQIDHLPAKWRNIDVLVNNAGLSLGLEPFMQGDTKDWDTMLDTNVKGLLYVSKFVSQGMILRKTGHIINIGSIAGKESYANGNVYCATKAAVDSLTKSMRIDLLPYGVKVTAIHPGAVETEFSIVRFKGDEQRAKKVYDGFQPLTPADVADAVYYAASRPAHVNVNDMLLMPTAQATASIIDRK